MATARVWRAAGYRVEVVALATAEAEAQLSGLDRYLTQVDEQGVGRSVSWGNVFFAQQAAHLSVAPAALYAFWQLAGLLGLVGGFFGNAGARITWVLFGCGSLAMIWSASPAGGRAAVTGLAALMWALASIFACAA
ncbi:zeta toxin family protein [Streptomyces sp. NPDC048258]|uniref:zeta toxin family protein n=1 Tax=Streptomyces sp. NPDC048258 TaxID=3365527 RepID=UPI00371C9AD0